MKTKVLLMIIGLTAFLTACSSSKSSTTSKNKAPVPTQSDLERSMKKNPSLTKELVEAGRINFQTQCSKCHTLKKPHSRTEDEWRQVVPKMAAKAKHKFNTDVIDEAMQKSILTYLGTMAKQ